MDGVSEDNDDNRDDDVIVLQKSHHRGILSLQEIRGETMRLKVIHFLFPSLMDSMMDL
jgi:hypothetical protein